MQLHSLIQSVIRAVGIPVGRAMLAVDSDSGSGLLAIGMASAMRGNIAGAEQHLTRLVELDPNTIHGRLWLSRIRINAGRVADARQFALEATNLDPENPLVQAQMAECDAAAAQFLTLQVCDQWATVAARPTVVHFGLGVALWGMGRTSDAIWMMERAIEEDPTYLPAVYELLGIYRRLDGPQDELRVARLAAEIACDSASQTGLAYSLISNGKIEEAEECLRTATAMAPHNATELANVGFIHQVLGHVGEATSYFEASIGGCPRQGTSYYWLSQSRKATEEDRPRIDKMKELSADPTLDPSARESLAFALGKSLEDLGNYEDAMKHFEEANSIGYKLKFGTMPYDRAKATTSFAEARKFTGGGKIERHDIVDNLSPLPIFIVGMGRSGTTLMEQILSSHPKVGAAGEQPFWSAHHEEVCDDRGLDPARLKSLCEEYCGILKNFGGEKEFVTDKRPDNFYRVGVLSSAFPQAKFIHMKRHPADNCLSIFTTPNSAALAWANDKDNIAHYYGLCQELMEYWQSVLPPGRMLTVRYEDLIGDTERVVKEICQFCELEWDPVMLHPERNLRPVITPSLGQVRKPIYKSSVARWKRYEPWLGEILTLVPEDERGIAHPDRSQVSV